MVDVTLLEALGVAWQSTGSHTEKIFAIGNKYRRSARPTTMIHVAAQAPTRKSSNVQMAPSAMREPRQLDRAAEDDLVTAAKNGSSAAFLQLVRTYDDDLRGLAYSITGSASEMDDVLQSSYLKAFQALPTFKGNSSFKTWIYRIVHNTAIDAGRRSSRITYIGDDTRHEQTAPTHDADAVMDVNAALDRLPTEQRTAILLVDGAGFDYATAAEITNVPLGTLSSRVNLARIRLRTLLAVYEKDFRS